MIALIDNLLDRITMYRLVLYFLIALLAVAAAFGAVGWLPYSPVAIVFSTAVIIFASWAANGIFEKAFDAQANSESHLITALILALIITPVEPMAAGATAGMAFLIWAGVLAMASKYIIAVRKKHFFNPAAFAVALTALALGQAASWWVGGNLPLLPFVFVGGLLVVRKIQRFDLVLPFFALALASTAMTDTISGPLTTIQKTLIHTPIFFFAFIMLTEPATTPPTRPGRIAYGAFVGLLFAPAMHAGTIYSTPELALLAGNVLAWLLSPKAKHEFAFVRKTPFSGGIYDFVFRTDAALRFRPGQYMEWTLAHEKGDGRGNRRYFTLASSPTERDLHLGIRFNDPPSSFKKSMLSLPKGGRIMGGQLAGDFTLPRDPRAKLAFIAGGIGITPFRSMVKYLSDRNERRDAVLLYSNREAANIAYRDVFDEASRTIGLRTLYAVTGKNSGAGSAAAAPPPAGVYAGRIDAGTIQAVVPDYLERIFYISGTHAMTEAFKKTLAELGVPKRHIKTDFFPGYS